jgi:YD repeat-containing protein
LLTGITDPLGRTLWTYADHAAGQLPSTTDPLGWMTMVVYNCFDERTAMTGPSGTTTTDTYNAGSATGGTAPDGEV